MTYRRRECGRRPAFTLIEVLVVIAIIAILVAMTATAVMHALARGPVLQANSELHEMDQRLANVQHLQGHELDSLPSALILRKQNGYNLNNPVEAATVKFLQKRFGRQTCYNSATQPFTATLPAGTFIDWNGDGNANEVVPLEGEQVLLFLLGGIPQYGSGLIGMTGFSENVQNPALPGGSRQGPYFEFQSGRLRLLIGANTPPAGTNFTAIPPYTAASAQLPGGQGDFPIYLDPFNAPNINNAPAPRWGPIGMPYAFYASSVQNGGGNYDPYGVNDCATLNAGPYYQQVGPPAQWVNPNSWQIMCAGPNGVFGQGGQWNSSFGQGPNGPGVDDQANFSPNRLGAGGN